MYKPFDTGNLLLRIYPTDTLIHKTNDNNTKILFALLFVIAKDRKCISNSRRLVNYNIYSTEIYAAINKNRWGNTISDMQ